MDLLPSEDQLTLAAATATFCEKYSPLTSIRDRCGEPTAFDPKVWLAGAELGLLGVSAGEEVGGSGEGLDDHALVFRELGRALAPGPFLGSVLGAELAARCEHPTLARRMIEGLEPVAVALTAGAELSPVLLSGELRLVDATNDGYALVHNEFGAGLVAISEFTERTELPCIDPGSRLSLGRADRASVSCWVPSGEHPLHLRGTVLAAAQLVGIAESCRDIATAFATSRVQFDKPIGVNQAIKHRCADMAVACEAALQQTLVAAICVRDQRCDAEFQTRAAKVIAGRAAIVNAAAAVHIHGGMGFTYEHDVHLYLKRAHVLDLLLGNGMAHMGPLIELPPAH